MLNTKRLAKFSLGMFGIGQILKYSSNNESEIFKKYNYIQPFRLPMLEHPAFGNTFIYNKSASNENDKAEKIAENICNQINYMEDIDLIPVYCKAGANTIKIKLKPMNNVKKSFNLQRQLKYVVGNEETRIYSEGDKIVLEIPNKGKTVRFGDFMHDVNYRIETSKTLVPIGKDVDGKIVYGDLAKMPHMLVAGTTGSGKSVFINGVITSLLMRNTPYDMKLILIDPKMVEFRRFSTLNYVRYITETNESISVLSSLCNEMDKRYRIMANNGCRDIDTYNKKFPNQRMPKIVLVVDEMADMMVNKKFGKQVEQNIIRIAQKARACGIHMILATQKPTRDIVTGLIKANIPCRVCLSVTSRMDSMIVLDRIGGEKLQGNGDMLYLNGINNKEPQRLQAGLITDDEICNVVIPLALDNQIGFADSINWNGLNVKVREYYGR